MATRKISPLPIAVLISGGGTTLQNLLKKINDGSLPVRIVLVISSNPAAEGLQFAANAGIGSLIVRKEDHPKGTDYSEAIFGPCREAGAELVVMGGFLKHVLIPGDFTNRVINIHPALIPAFSGKGMYGERVHQAVLDKGAKVTGCTVHFVDDEYDHGPIILQKVVPVEATDTVADIQKRVFQAECEALPEVIRLIVSGNIQADGRIVTVVE